MRRAKIKKEKVYDIDLFPSTYNASYMIQKRIPAIDNLPDCNPY